MALLGRRLRSYGWILPVRMEKVRCRRRDRALSLTPLRRHPISILLEDRSFFIDDHRLLKNSVVSLEKAAKDSHNTKILRQRDGLGNRRELLKFYTNTKDSHPAIEATLQSPYQIIAQSSLLISNSHYFACFEFWGSFWV